MKTKIKRHSRAVISVILAVCMLVSCMTVGLIATDAAKVTETNAVGAKVDDGEKVGATYYLYYRRDNTKSLSDMTSVLMTASGANYTAEFTANSQNFVLAFGNSSSATSSLVRSSWTVTKDSGLSNWTGIQDNSGVYYVCGWATSGTKITVTFNGSNKVTLSSTAPSTECSDNKSYVVAGESALTGVDWNNTSTKNTMTYNSTIKKYEITYSVTSTSAFNWRIVESGNWTEDYGKNQAHEVDNNNICDFASGSDHNNIKMTLSQAAIITIQFDDSKTDTSAITVIVTPAKSTVTAAVTPAGTGTATVNSGATASNIEYGNSVTLVATPAANYHFGSWASTNGYLAFANSTSATTTATVLGTDTATATFVPDSFTVTKSKDASYTITAPTAGTAQYTTTVTVSATASDAYYIDGLYYVEGTDDPTVAANQNTIFGSNSTTETNESLTGKTFTMPASNVTIYAWTHKKGSQVIEYDPAPSNGYVSVGLQHGSTDNEIEQSYAVNTEVIEGTKVNFCAIPVKGKKFIGWYKDSGFSTPVEGDSFSDPDITVTAGASGELARYAKFGADPNVATAGIRVFIKNTYANWEVKVWNTTSPDYGNDGDWQGHGSVALKNFTDAGCTTVTIGANTYYRLDFPNSSVVNIRLGTNDSDNMWATSAGTYIIDTYSTSAMTAYTADVAAKDIYPVHLNVVNPDKGTDHKTYVKAYAENSKTVETYIQPASGDQKANVTAVNASTSAELTNQNYLGSAATHKDFTMPADAGANVTVTYNEKAYYKVTYSAGLGGAVRANIDTASGTLVTSGSTVQEGKKVVFTATPQSGYSVSGWTVTGDLSGTSTATTRNVASLTQDTTARVYFTKSRGTENSNTYFSYMTSATTDNDKDPNGFTTFYKTYRRNGRVYAYIDTVDSTKAYYIAAFDEKPDGIENTYKKMLYWKSDASSAPINGETHFSGSIQNISQRNWGGYSGKAYYVRFTITSDVQGLIIDLGPDDGSGNARPDQDGDKYRIIPIYNTDYDKVTVYAKDASYRGNDNYDYFPYVAETDLTGTVTNVSNHTATHTTEYNNDGTPKTQVQSHVFDTGVAAKGATITVTTTIDANHKGSFYIRGYSVNGVTPQLFEYNSDGVYTMDYTIPNDFEYDYLEITPIYYYKHTTEGDFTSDKMVSFYIENYDKAIEAEGWGNTLSVYPYYQNASGGYAATKHNAFGGYPGQPVIYYGGRRFIEIPISYTTFTVDAGSTGAQENCFIKGMTLSNDYFDIIHRDFCREVDQHLQTYDYDDFYKIAKETMDGKEVNQVDPTDVSDPRHKTADQITFAFKYRESTNNFKDNETDAKVAYSDTGKTVHVPYSNFTSAEKTSKFGNGWEPLLDYHDRPVDIFGKQLTTEEQNQEPVLVVSDDYAINYVGRYATTWTVYAWDSTTSKYVNKGEIAPSALIVTSSTRLTDTSYPTVADETGKPKQTTHALSTYSTVYTALEAYRGYPVEITYESAIRNDSEYEKYWSMTKGSSEVSKRNDGRWFYSYEGEAINANLRIEYKNPGDSDDDYVADTFRAGTNKGTVTGASVQFKNSTKSTGGTYELSGYNDTKDYNEDYPDNPILSNQNDYFNFEATNGSGYIFAGWYFERDGIVTSVNEDLTKLDGSSQMTSNATFVARYIKNPSGNLTINHTVAESSVGSATTYVAVKAVDRSTAAETWLTGDGTEAGRFEEDVCNISDPTYTSYKSGYTFVVELKTVTDSFTNFDRFSSEEGVSADYFSTVGQRTVGNTTTTYFEVDSDDLFALEDSFPVQTFDTLTYYSHLTGKTYNYDFNFTYPAYNPDFGNQGYRVTGTFVYDDLAKNMKMTGEDLEFKDSDTKTAFLNKIAPYEDNFMQTITWNTSVATSFDTSTGTISAEVPAVYDSNKKIPLTFKLNYTPDEETYQPSETPGYRADNERYVMDIAKADWPLHLNTFQKNGQYVTAPKTLVNDGKTYIFRYWSVSTVPDAKHSSVEYTRCYADEFNYVLFQKSIVTSVYTERTDVSDIFDPNKQQNADESMGVTISFIENSRNQYNDSQSGNLTTQGRTTQGDRMYTDFLLSYNAAAKDPQTGQVRTLKEIGTDKMRAGLIIEVVGDIDLVDGKYITKTEAEYREIYGDTISAIGTKLSGLDTTVNQLDRLKHYIDGTEESNPIRGAKSEFDVSKLDNKNRIQYYYSLANRSHSDFSVLDNRYKVFRAYSYIADVEKVGTKYNYSNIKISDKPVYFTIYDMASIEN